MHGTCGRLLGGMGEERLGLGCVVPGLAVLGLITEPGFWDVSAWLF